MFVDVGAVEEFQEGIPRVVTVNGRQVGVIRWRDEVYALRNICPHQLGPVCGGHTMPLILAEEGVARVDEDTLVIVCPWHSWEFDARSGKSLWSERFRLKTYQARAEDGRVLVDGGKADVERERAAGSPSAVAQS